MRRIIAILVFCVAGFSQDFAGYGDALTKGRELYAAKQFEPALQAFQFAFSRAQSPKESAQATARIGQTLAELGRTREAIEYMQRSLDFFHYDQVEAQLKELRVKLLAKVQTTDEISAALHDQQASNRSTRVMPRRPLALRVNFDFDKATLTDEGRAQVDQLGAALADFQGERILITGHTDLVGQANYNQSLSEQRAQNVAAEIMAKFGLPASVLLTQGKGMREPLYNSTGPDDSRLNRRVEVTLLKPDEAPAQAAPTQEAPQQ